MLADGTRDGSDVLVAQGVAYIYDDLGLAYNAARDEFLVVWSGGSEADIYGRRVKMSGGLATEGAVFPISEVADGHPEEKPAVGVVATNDGAGEYLVAWRAYSDFFHYELKAQRVTDLGILEGTTTILCDSDTFLCSRPAVSGIGNQRFEVIWTASESERYGAGIYGVTMGKDGSLSPARTWLTGDKRGGSVNISAWPWQQRRWCSTRTIRRIGCIGTYAAIFLAWDSNWAYLPFVSK